jgi:hypothetical protein
MFLLTVAGQSLLAEDIAGKWYRREGSRVVDVMIIEKVGRGYHATFKVSEESAPYSDGHGYYRNGTFWMALMNLDTGGSGFGIYQLTSAGTFTGKSLNLDGKVRWEGTFTR